ncbi:YibE/F family protein [Plebeiibacterium sediminum]|uniref:YibE/F family protein n=1 Tax=Plebeiibacterium sediminum TaxID=2992112 RepID=A0AAE3M3V5_9BACT|nr:YibE/F family protein [Plebeiobacterium sediminum]MCW3786501.1 YibE/F family protein [Plebeiobacterium sediminum]
MLKTHKRKINIAFTITISILTIILIYLPTGHENPRLLKNTDHVKAQVIAVNNDDLDQHGIVTVGTQDLNLKLLSGNFKGDTVIAHNILIGQKKLDKIFKPGNKVLTVLKFNKSGSKIIEARADDFYRIQIEWILLGLFALFLVCFAGITGFKALLSFIFTALAFWKILLPLFLKGYSPIIVSFGIIVLCTTVIIILINGFSRKGWVALLGAISGVGITTSMALLFAHFFKVSGTVKEFSETLLYTGYTHLDLTAIFISCIFIAAAGAVMDVAMDIAAAQHEVLEHNPSIKKKELMKSGFNVAYPVIGTMTTTLLFAYSGSFMFVFMVFMAKGTPLISICNTNYIAAEILHTLVGSFGLVLVAPITAILGGLIYPIKDQNK